MYYREKEKEQTWKEYREKYDRRDIEMYKKYKKIEGEKKWCGRQRNTERERYIENHINWEKELERHHEERRNIRMKNERKNQILKNWRRIENEEQRKKDNVTIHNRYIVLEDMEEEEEKKRRECDEDIK